jgi:hypothetical protein
MLDDYIALMECKGNNYDCDDIEVIGDRIKCLVCGGTSGTAKIITHKFDCKYKNDYVDTISHTVDDKGWSSSWINLEKHAVGQRECKIIDSENDCIIGSIGAGPCLILCLRDTISKKVALAHIDANTKNQFEPFHQFSPDTSEVYLVGGNNNPSSIKLAKHILSWIKINNYKLVMLKIISSHTQSFAINNNTGNYTMNVPSHQLWCSDRQIMKIKDNVLFATDYL